jgi:hypothetical protein
MWEKMNSHLKDVREDCERKGMSFQEMAHTVLSEMANGVDKDVPGIKKWAEKEKS